jgi:hypothetical protein
MIDTIAIFSAVLWMLLILLITADNYKNSFFNKGLLIVSLIDAFFKTIFLMALSVMFGSLALTATNGS